MRDYIVPVLLIAALVALLIVVGCVESRPLNGVVVDKEVVAAHMETRVMYHYDSKGIATPFYYNDFVPETYYVCVQNDDGYRWKSVDRAFFDFVQKGDIVTDGVASRPSVELPK